MFGMKFLCTNFIFGLLLILFGISIIVKVIFGVHIPIIRSLLAIALIYAGVTMLTSSGRKKQEHFFSCITQETDEATHTYSTFMGKRVIDLSHLATGTATVNCSFGGTDVLIDAQIPTKIIINAGFSGVTLPNGDVISFGTYTYRSRPGAATDDVVITLNAAFSGTRIIIKK